MVQLSTWVDLWDQSLGLIRYNESGVFLHQRACKFLTEFGKMQAEAIAAQKKLCKKYAVDNQKIFGMESSYGDAFNAFLCVVQLVLDAEGLVSTAFELQAENDVKFSLKDEKKKIKFWKGDRSKMFLEMKTQIRIIDDEIKRYRDRYRDMVKANEEHMRIYADSSRSRADVEKAALTAQQKSLDFNRARDDYSAALNQFNIYRKDYFSRVFPNWSQAGYELAAERYSRTQQLLSVLHERIQVASERMNMASRKLQETCSNCFLIEKDTEVMIDKLRSGYPPPDDIEFVDLLTSAAAQQSIGTTRGSKSSQQSSVVDFVKNPSAFDTMNSNHESEDPSNVIYASSSLVLPPDFHCSVSSADLAAFEAAGLPIPGRANGGVDAPTLGGNSCPESIIYAALVGNASLTAGGNSSSTAAGGTLSNSWRTLSANSTSGASSGGGRSNLLRRFFSRSIRATDVDQVNTSSKTLSRRFYNRTTTDLLPSKPLVTDDSSDFSESSLDLHIHSGEQSAYAHTDVLAGLRKPYSDFAHNNPSNGHSASSAPITTTPLAAPESPSTHHQITKSSQLTGGAGSLSSHTYAASDSTKSAYQVSNIRCTPSSSHSTTPQRTGYATNINNGMPIHVPTLRAPSIPYGVEKVNSSPTKERPGDGHSPSGLTSQDYIISGGSSPKHFFARQPKVRTDSTDDTAIIVGRCTALYHFSAQGFDSCYFPFDAGETFYILAPSPTEDTTDWLRVLHGRSYEEGYVPTSYMERCNLPQPQIMPIPNVSGTNDVSKIGTGHSSSVSPGIPSSPASKRECTRRKVLAASQFGRLTAGGVTRDTEL